MKTKYLPLFVLFVLSSCTPSQLRIDWSEITIGKNNYIARTSMIPHITRCLENRLDTPCVPDDVKNEQARKVVKRVMPLDKFMSVNGISELRFTLSIDPEGEVLMTKIDSFSQNIPYALVKESAINTLNLKFEKDENAPCMTCVKYCLNIKVK